MLKALIPLLLSIQFSLSAAEPPAKVLDLTHWKLKLPRDTRRSGRPDEIEQPQLDAFADPQCFFANERQDGVVFRANCGGVTTKGSDYPRCELREMQATEHEAAWNTDDSQSHTLTMTAAITQTPRVKPHVVCAQIHDAKDDVLMVRLEGRKLLVERESNRDVVLDSNYVRGTPFDLKIQAGDGQIRVWHAGALKLEWKAPRKGCYFKAGCYTQSNIATGDTADSYGEVVIHRLLVEHQKPQ